MNEDKAKKILARKMLEKRRELGLNDKIRRKQRQFKELRENRNEALKNTDWTMLADAPIEMKERLEYRKYRQYLRDLPASYKSETIQNYKILTFSEWKECQID
jgi:hypothetical protein